MVISIARAVIKQPALLGELLAGDLHVALQHQAQDRRPAIGQIESQGVVLESDRLLAAAVRQLGELRNVLSGVGARGV